MPVKFELIKPAQILCDLYKKNFPFILVGNRQLLAWLLILNYGNQNLPWFKGGYIGRMAICLTFLFLYGIFFSEFWPGAAQVKLFSWKN